MLKGPVADPQVHAPDGTEAGILGGVLRTGLDVYANIRPIRLYPGVTSALSGMSSVCCLSVASSLLLERVDTYAARAVINKVRSAHGIERRDLGKLSAQFQPEFGSA